MTPGTQSKGTFLRRFACQAGNRPGQGLNALFFPCTKNPENQAAKLDGVSRVLTLYLHSIHSAEQMQKHISEAIEDYNEHRPHGQLKGLTPSEAYAGMELKDLHVPEKLEEARRMRVERNRKRSR
ncbi:MAG: transposase [Bacteroidia bacterium]|nr:transposase [Bacteroidia bacterium]